MKDPGQRLEHLGTRLTSAVGQARSWNDLHQPTQVVPRSWGGREKDHPRQITFLNTLGRLVSSQSVEGCGVSWRCKLYLGFCCFPTRGPKVPAVSLAFLARLGSEERQVTG